MVYESPYSCINCTDIIKHVYCRLAAMKPGCESLLQYSMGDLLAVLMHERAYSLEHVLINI